MNSFKFGLANMERKVQEEDGPFSCPVCSQNYPSTQETYSTTDIFSNRSHLQVCSKECMRSLMDNWLAGEPRMRLIVHQQIDKLSPSSHTTRPKRCK